MIGGIYNKPIAIGKLTHFAVSAIALLKLVFKIQLHSETVIVATVIYMLLALCFGYVFLNNPSNVKTD